MPPTLSPLLSTPAVGFVNGLAIAQSGKFLAAAIGQEHRLGRWFRIKEARNSLAIIPLPQPLHAKPRLNPVRARPRHRAPGLQEQDADEGDDLYQDDELPDDFFDGGGDDEDDE